jgi:1,6-anhydro-N-acetylmuramate kinase
MIFPLPSIWFDSPVNEVNVALRVDRFEDAKRHRMAIGIHVTEDFQELHGSLLIVSGHGKYLRSCSWSGDKTQLPHSLRTQLLSIKDSQQAKLIELSQLKGELALCQSQMVVRLKEKAGKYVDRILAVSVSDSGLWLKDFDGQPIYHSLCDSERLAQLSGLNVIDAFPARDVACEGTGRSLEALPLWLMFADRDPREATRSRLAVLVGDECEAVFLPGSDGLDAELPAIQSKTICGESLFNHLANRAGGLGDEKALELLTLNGKTSSKLMNAWKEIELEPSCQAVARRFAEFENQQSSIEIADALRSCIVLAANQLMDWSANLDTTLPIDQATICGNTAFSTLLTNELSNRVRSGSNLTVTAGPSQSETLATIAAMLGFLAIDQMPASLPWLTGCTTPQVLGRITAGRPSNWRQLLVEMADYRPPVMKLNDAV